MPFKASFLVQPANSVNVKRVIIEIVYVGMIKRLVWNVVNPRVVRLIANLN